MLTTSGYQLLFPLQYEFEPSKEVKLQYYKIVRLTMILENTGMNLNKDIKTESSKWLHGKTIPMPTIQWIR